MTFLLSSGKRNVRGDKRRIEPVIGYRPVFFRGELRKKVWIATAPMHDARRDTIGFFLPRARNLLRSS